MTTIDLKDAFLSVLIHADHRKFLRFQWKGALYEFQCLPFGLTSAPCVFTKLLRPVMTVLHWQGIRCMTFIDDLLLLHPSRKELKKISVEVSHHVPSAGIPHQPGEIWSHSLSENDVSGLHRQFGLSDTLSDTLSSHGEVGQDSPGMLSCFLQNTPQSGT